MDNSIFKVNHCVLIGARKRTVYHTTAGVEHHSLYATLCRLVIDNIATLQRRSTKGYR